MASNNNRLIGRKIAITGGARGIGRSTAEAFLAQGARVVIGDIDADLVRKVAAEIAEKTGATIVGIGLDVTDRASFADFLDTATTELGGLDVLVNNAGIMPTGSFLDESDTVTDRQVDINVHGVITGSKLAGAKFAQQGQGHLVNIASVAGLAAAPGVAVYCAGKYAVVGLGSALKQELGPLGVQVTTIAPGFVNTELIAGLSPNRLVRTIGMVEPEDIARAIVDAVAGNRTGLRVVPWTGGLLTKALNLVPEDVAIWINKALGLHAVTLDSDESVRAAYRARTEAAT